MPGVRAGSEGFTAAGGELGGLRGGGAGGSGASRSAAQAVRARGELPLLLPATGCALGVLCGGSDRRAGPVSLCGSAGSRAVARLPE